MREELLETALAGYDQLAKPNRGRSLIVGRTEDGLHLALINLAGGRSFPSQNREYEQKGREVYTKVFDPNLPSGDPDATIYLAQNHNLYLGDHHGAHVVISNGLQTQRILDTLQQSGSMGMALWPFYHEGEKNAFTPRIAVGAEITSGKDASFGRVYADPVDPSISNRWSEEMRLHDGLGYFISTYNGEGGTKTSLEAPTMLAFQGSFEDIVEKVWSVADPNTTAMMAARRIRIGNPEDFTVILRNRTDIFRGKYLSVNPAT